MITIWKLSSHNRLKSNIEPFLIHVNGNILLKESKFYARYFPGILHEDENVIS